MNPARPRPIAYQLGDAAVESAHRASRWLHLGYCVLAVDVLGLLTFHAWWIVWLARSR